MSLHSIISDLERIKGILESESVHRPPYIAQKCNDAAGFQSSRPLETAEKIYKFREKRAHFFSDDGLFGEPAWDILLDLFIAQSQGRRISITSACIGSGTPPTTGLRWLKALEMRDIIRSKPDAQDKRRRYVELSPNTFEKMQELLSSFY